MVWLKSLAGATLLSCLAISPLSARQGAPSANGLWLSDGYGLLLEVSDQSLQAYELTSISCIVSWSAKRDPGSTGREMVFTGDNVFRLSDGPSVDVRRLHLDGTTADIFLHRTAQRPQTCNHAPENNPQKNYAVFWETFAEQYAFFDLRHVDWKSIDNKFRPRVTAATKPEELFAIFRQMTEPLQDTHTGIEAPDIKQEFDGWRQDPGHLEADDWKKAESVIDSRYVRGGLHSFCNGHVQFGMLDHSVGYLRITAFYGYVDKYTYGDALHALQSALDTIFQDSNRLTGLIVDVRLNNGGDDPLGIEIASRLTDHKYLAYSKVTRNNLTGPLHFTDPQQCWVVPVKRPGFRGNVVLLTGPDTVSAGETFTMALMERKLHLTRIGLNTQGVFSDVLIRHLPNGWRFDLPNEVYLTSGGKAFDVTGVPPDIRLNFFSREDLRDNRDAALEEALKILGAAASSRNPD
jgi:hypothetical protein